jgi:FMN-dependent NADH-azoreductase
MDESYSREDKVREFLDEYLSRVPEDEVDTQDMADQIVAILEP